eukprot:COSAG06_NODE_31158_length_526_cov_0.796253_1_plen_146_part_01
MLGVVEAVCKQGDGGGKAWTEADHSAWLQGDCTWNGQPHVPQFGRLVKEQHSGGAAAAGASSGSRPDGRSQRGRVHELLTDATLAEVEAWWMNTDEHLPDELRRPAGVAASIGRVRAVFSACAERRPSEIEEVFPQVRKSPLFAPL